MLVNDGALKDVSTRDMADCCFWYLPLSPWAYILSYWKVNYAGMLLIAVSLAFAIHSFYYLNNGQIALWLLTGMPQLVAGGLLLLGWRMKKDNKLR
jgi:hypothetical protein